MVYVHQSFSTRVMEVISDEFIEEHKDKIKDVTRKGFMPRRIKMNNGDIYLFMTYRYYEKDFVKGRREDIDYVDLRRVPGDHIYQGG